MSLRSVGLFMVTAGFLLGALAATWHPVPAAEPNFILQALDRLWQPPPLSWSDFGQWTYFLPAMALGIAGVVCTRVAAKRAATAPERVKANFAILEQSLKETLAGLAELNPDADVKDPYDLPARIDTTLRAPLEAFVDSRESILHVHGANAYADVMTHFAAGERYLNRVWSSAADGYANEASDYLKKSREQFELASTHLSELLAKTAESH